MTVLNLPGGPNNPSYGTECRSFCQLLTDINEEEESWVESTPASSRVGNFQDKVFYPSVDDGCASEDIAFPILPIG